MKFPEFNVNGDLPVDIYNATLAEVLEHFGKGSLQRQVVALRLKKVYFSAMQTKEVLRSIVYGSFVTNKENPNDVDIFMVMQDDFNPNTVVGKIRLIFKHLTSQEYEGASIFWGTKSGIIGDVDEFVAGWQIKRDQSRRGIIEIELEVHTDD